MTRIDIINTIIQKNNFDKYLEIGLRNPEDCFNHIQCETKHSVDPGYETEQNEATYKYTSDEFFSLLEKGELDLNPYYQWDVIFIDGLHLSWQVEKDISRALRNLNYDGTIVVHDCNPPDIYHAREDYSDHSTPAEGAWCGTVWKAIYKMRCQRSDLKIFVVDSDYGCGIVKNGMSETIPFDNPYFEYNIFSKNRQKYLNLKSVEEAINLL
jgi:hypothetical protein